MPSSLYTFFFRSLARDCPSGVSPNLTSFTIVLSRRCAPFDETPALTAELQALEIVSYYI